MTECDNYRNKKNNVRLLQDEFRKGIRFDMTYLAPPLKISDFIKNSPLASPEGWVPAHKESLQHIKYENIFGLGDVAHISTAKAGIAIRKQAPTIFLHSEVDVGEIFWRKNHGQSGYTFATGYWKALLEELKYKNLFTPEFGLNLLLIFNSHKERRRLRIIKNTPLTVPKFPTQRALIV